MSWSACSSVRFPGGNAQTCDRRSNGDASAPTADGHRGHRSSPVPGASPVLQAVANDHPESDDAETWRATRHIWEVVSRFIDMRRAARFWGVPAQDTYYNLLRFIDSPDVASVGNAWLPTAKTQVMAE